MAHALRMLDNLGYKHTEYLTLTVFPRQQWLHECASALRYTYVASLLVF
jgi:hypothetical protein